VDAETDGLAFVFQAIDTNPITHVAFRYGQRALTPPTYVLKLESVDASSGHPTGTDVGGGSPTAKTFTPPADDSWNNSQQTIALTNSYTPTRGQFLAATIRWSTGTVDSSNYSTFTTHALSGFAPGTFQSFPYPDRLNAGTWAKQTGIPIVMVRTGASRYGLPFEGFYNTRSASTVGHRHAMKFTIPNSLATTFAVRGIRFFGSIASAGGKNPIIGLWSAAGVLQGFTADSDVVASLSSFAANEYYFDEANLTPLSANTAYYAGLEVADSTNGGVLLNGIQLDDAADLAAYPLGGNMHFATYDGSAWTDDMTVRPFLELILDEVGGGIITHPGMVGGCRG
jgi:hypothetical protein